MTCDTLQDGEKIFIDANIFVYHFGKLSTACKTLLARCCRGEIIGYTSTSIIAEVLHRLMIVEAVKKDYISSKNPIKQLKRHPDTIKQLSDYHLDAATIPQMGITILNLTQAHIEASAAIRATEGLLTNDSLILAVMKDADIVNLATNDNDFAQVAWLNVYKPADVQPYSP